VAGDKDFNPCYLHINYIDFGSIVDTQEMKIIKRCRCIRPSVCGYDPTTCMVCRGRVIKALHAAREFDRANGIVRAGERDNKVMSLTTILKGVLK
jgi:hypothetical protein